MKKDTKTTKKPEPKQITHAEHFRLRPPSEKPTKEDADTGGCILIWDEEGNVFYHDWQHSFDGEAVAWLPGHLPAHLIPQPETAEARMRREFEAWARTRPWTLDRDAANKDYANVATRNAWLAWQAARKGVEA